MIDLKKLILPDLKMIITEYKKYISPKLTGLNKDELIKLINKFNIVLSKKYDNKIKLIKEKKEKKEPKILSEEEKRKKEIKIEKLKVIYDKRSKEYIKKETLKEIEELKKEGRWTEPKPEKKKVDFNFTSLYIPSKLKKSNYNDEQLNALYGDYETNYNNENMNNIATIMKEKQQYKYVYDRFKEFIEYFISVDVDKFVDDLISYDFHYQNMPKSERTRMPFFNNDIYISNVDKTMSRDDYGDYIKKAIEDIKADIKQNEKAKKKDIKEPKPKKEPKVKVIKTPKPKKEPKVKVVKTPKPKKEPKVKVIKPQLATNEDNKKIKNEWFTEKRRKELLILRKNNPLIGDIIDRNVEHYNRLMLPTNGKLLINNIDWYNPKKYKRLEKYIDEIVKYNKQDKNKPKINILKFINNQITQHNTPYLFYPPYLQNYIALNGLYILHKVIEILFISINKNMKDYIIIKSKDEIEQYENKHYSYLKNISPMEKSKIRMYYHNFIPNDYKHYNDFYLSYYVHI